MEIPFGGSTYCNKFACISQCCIENRKERNQQNVISRFTPNFFYMQNAMTSSNNKTGRDCLRYQIPYENRLYFDFFLDSGALTMRSCREKRNKKLFTDIGQFFLKKELFGKERYQRLQQIKANWLRLFQLTAGPSTRNTRLEWKKFFITNCIERFSVPFINYFSVLEKKGLKQFFSP